MSEYVIHLMSPKGMHKDLILGWMESLFPEQNLGLVLAILKQKKTAK
jgi:hypothetical protein